MSSGADLKLGEQLYRLLPEIYRTRDKKSAGEVGVVDQSLARYLDAQGSLLDLIHATFRQQLKDALPESSQEWLLPYFAKLVATRILSPESRGRHAEVSNAVGWRQRKGSLKCAEEIAETVGEVEAEMQEGWKRVAITPRIGMPMIKAAAVDSELNPDMQFPHEAISHPFLPAATVDLRAASRAMEAKGDNPAAKSSGFGGIRQIWHQANRHGAPCFPGSYEDGSRRTVDLRTPDHTNGHYHPKRLMLFTPPPTGFFRLEPVRMTWVERTDTIHEHLLEEFTEGDVTVIRNRTERIIEITDAVSLDSKSYRIEGINFQQELMVPKGGKLELVAVGAERVTVKDDTLDSPVIKASGCLFRVLSAGSSLAELDSCTILGEAYLRSVEARDSIFMEIEGEDITGVFEYCRIPGTGMLSKELSKISIKSHFPNRDSKYGFDPVTDAPSFVDGQTDLTSCAVLAPDAPESIYAGASDHGEMGYFHNGRRYPVHITKAVKFFPPADGGYPLKELIFDKGLEFTSGQLILSHVAVPSLTMTIKTSSNDSTVPVLVASDCLFQSFDVSGLARLEYCTVMETARCNYLQASDCIFAEKIDIADLNEAKKFINCLRFSAVPRDLDAGLLDIFRFINSEGKLALGTNTMVRPVFAEFHFCRDAHDDVLPELRKPKYGDWGYGVPGPLTSDAILYGAEDGGEMGAMHHKHYTLKAKAMIEKLREFLPVGIEPVVIEDERLLHVPPEQTAGS